MGGGGEGASQRPPAETTHLTADGSEHRLPARGGRQEAGEVGQPGRRALAGARQGLGPGARTAVQRTGRAPRAQPRSRAAWGQGAAARQLCAPRRAERTARGEGAVRAGGGGRCEEGAQRRRFRGRGTAPRARAAARAGPEKNERRTHKRKPRASLSSGTMRGSKRAGSAWGRARGRRGAHRNGSIIIQVEVRKSLIQKKRKKPRHCSATFRNGCGQARGLYWLAGFSRCCRGRRGQRRGAPALGLLAVLDAGRGRGRGGQRGLWRRRRLRARLALLPAAAARGPRGQPRAHGRGRARDPRVPGRGRGARGHRQDAHAHGKGAARHHCGL